MPTAIKPRTNSKPKLPKQPLWRGPAEDGITQSLLQRFIVCRHRFWLKAVCGLTEEDAFDHKLEYGNLWHAAEEWHGNGKPWKLGVNKYADYLVRRYPADADKIQYWVKICCTQFPIYLEWASRVRENDRKVLCTERTFAIPYTLPSGRTILLRGKFDEIYRIGPLIYIKENKAKGEIDVEGITKTVAYNLQTMMYQIALRSALAPCLLHPSSGNGKPIPKNGSGQLIFDVNKPIPFNLPDTRKDKPYRVAGTLYNVIRRPLSDRFAIKQKKGRIVKDRQGNKVLKGAETTEQFMERLGKLIKAEPANYFHRWLTTLDQSDVDKFRRESFDPVLEQLCDWWESIAGDPFNPWHTHSEQDTGGFDPNGEPINTYGPDGPNPHHWQTPWGIYNSLASGWRGDYFDYLTSGSTYDLVKAQTLFPELA